MGRVLRKGMKNVILASYETARAFSRLAAIQAKSYTLEQNAQESNLLQITWRCYRLASCGR
jgi:phage terminase Nu1 subunit (DNA packaging protein)